MWFDPRMGKGAGGGLLILFSFFFFRAFVLSPLKTYLAKLFIIDPSLSLLIRFLCH